LWRALVENRTEIRCLEVLDLMVEEVQREAMYCALPQDALVALAKRDALSELSLRLRRGEVNWDWARRRPQLAVLSN
jgi:hypothetical protein